MAEQVFCIDFGSAYTKVGLRRHPTADGELINDRGIETADFCYHSVVVIDRTGQKPLVECGKKAAGRTASNGIEVYHNWKQWLFLTPAAPAPSDNPVEAFLRSQALVALAAQHGITSGQLGQLRQMVSAARELLAGVGIHPTSREAQRQQFAASLAVHYFSWLRQEVLKECERLPHAGLKYADIPARITVPAFAHGVDVTTHPGCKLLAHALEQARWPLHRDRPLVTEPFANAVGVLTNGTNTLKKNALDLGAMFSKGPIITAGKDPKHYAPYRAVVIDVGGFTTDFAVLTLRPDGLLASDPEQAFDVKQHSVPIALSSLDARIQSILPTEKATWWKSRSADEIEGVRASLYTENKPVRSGVLGTIGGTGPEGDAIRQQVAQFAADIAAEAQALLSTVGSGGTNELVLTGGGVGIPAVRDALLAAASAGGRDFIKVHGPEIQKKMTGKPVHKLDQRLARGGGALGGSSIYFEKDCY